MKKSNSTVRGVRRKKRLAVRAMKSALEIKFQNDNCDFSIAIARVLVANIATNADVNIPLLPNEKESLECYLKCLEDEDFFIEEIRSYPPIIATADDPSQKAQEMFTSVWPSFKLREDKKKVAADK